MKILIRNKRTEKGFTLLEVIVTLTVAAVLASFLVSFMGTAITKSSDPVNRARDLGKSISSMETISAAYACYLLRCTDNAICCAGCKCEWDKFKTACGSPDPIKSGGIYSSSFETIQVTTTTGSQQMVSYFMQ